MDGITPHKKKQGDIVVLHFGDFATFMLKDNELWLKLEDIWNFLTEAQRHFLVTDGVGLCEAINESTDGAYIRFDAFISSASPKAKPMLYFIKSKVLETIAREGAK